jgi:hypothetical protein
MTGTLEPLVLDLVEWVGQVPRPHRDVMDVWRTSCPRLTVWEEAVDRGYVARDWDPAQGAIIVLTPLGRAFLDAKGRPLSAGSAGDGRSSISVSRCPPLC